MKEVKTVLHLTSDVEGDWGHAIRSASLLFSHDDLVHEDVTLVPHRHGIKVVLPDSPLTTEVSNLIDQGVTVKAGASCFDALGVPREALPGVEIVPSGVAEVVKLQSVGYTYVKIP